MHIPSAPKWDQAVHGLDMADFLPFGFGPARTSQGEKVLLSVGGTWPLSIGFAPAGYSELQESLLPEQTRIWHGNSHYQLTATTARTMGFAKGEDHFADCFQ